MHHLLSKRPVDEGILILDYGSQYTLLIARRLRELGIYAEIIDGIAEKAPEGFNFHGGDKLMINMGLLDYSMMGTFYLTSNEKQDLELVQSLLLSITQQASQKFIKRSSINFVYKVFLLYVKLIMT